jgi:hypothetical protein
MRQSPALHQPPPENQACQPAPSAAAAEAAKAEAAAATSAGLKPSQQMC